MAQGEPGGSAPRVGEAMCLLLLISLILLWAIRVASLYRSRHSHSKPVRTMAVLGSGGHTAEMMGLLRTLDPLTYAPMLYVIAASDSTSLQRIEAFEQDRVSHATKGGQLLQPYQTLRIPRSREVGQSYLTSAFTTLYATLHAIALVFRSLPTFLLCNGPGTCVPICAVALLVRGRV